MSRNNAFHNSAGRTPSGHPGLCEAGMTGNRKDRRPPANPAAAAERRCKNYELTAPEGFLVSSPVTKRRPSELGWATVEVPIAVLIAGLVAGRDVRLGGCPGDETCHVTGRPGDETCHVIIEPTHLITSLGQDLRTSHDFYCIPYHPAAPCRPADSTLNGPPGAGEPPPGTLAFGSSAVACGPVRPRPSRAVGGPRP
jgi:hypothetical protein